MLASIRHLYRSVWGARGGLTRVVAPWFVLAVLGQFLVGHMPESLLEVSPVQWLGITLRFVALLSAWCCAHRWMMQPSAKADYSQQTRFISWQVVNLLALVLVAILLLVPGVIWLGLHFPDLPSEQIQIYSNQLAYLTLPVFLWLFGRLILTAPMVVRNEPSPSMHSWRATKGQGSRLFVMQLASLLPVFLAAGICLVLPEPVAIVVGLLGEMVSLLLYTRLAEDEYALSMKAIIQAGN